MSKKSIDAWSFKYWLLKAYVRFFFKNYYSKIKVVGLEKIPRNEPVIIPANHQNALMDALAILLLIPFQPVFLARSDIFSSPLLVKILTAIKIMPIYRIRDGADKLKKNEEIFEKTIQVLHNKENPLCIMPEGNHGDKRRLRPLVKGIFRIAFKAQEEFGTNPGVKLYPVGIDYGHYQNIHHHLFINYGDPISIHEYVQKYEKNQAATVNELREKLAEELKKVMIHIESEDYYDLYMHLRTIYRNKMCEKLGLDKNDLQDRFEADKHMIAILDEKATEEELNQLKEKDLKYQDGLKKAGLRDWVIEKKRHGFFEMTGKTLMAILGFPLFLTGLVTGYIPFKIPTLFVKKIKDKQFHSSVKFVSAVLLFTVYYLILGILALIFIRPFWIAFIAIALFYPTSKFALEYYIFLKKLLAQWRYIINRKHLMNLKKLRAEIIQLMDLIVAK